MRYDLWGYIPVVEMPKSKKHDQNHAVSAKTIFYCFTSTAIYC